MNTNTSEKISILVLNYKTKDLTKRCVESIIANSKSFFEIIIIDNFSEDGSFEFLFNYFKENKKVKVIKTNKNLGFGGGFNYGIKQAEGDFILILNSDTLFFEDSILNLSKFYNKHEKVGFLQPKLYLNDEKTKIHISGTKIPSFLNILQVHTSFLKWSEWSRNFNNFRYSDWDRESSKRIDIICGAAMYIKKDIFNLAGCFDERFFLYFEENDICRRLIKLGYNNYYVSEAALIHYEGKSPKSLHKNYLKSLLKYIIKYNLELLGFNFRI